MGDQESPDKSTEDISDPIDPPLEAPSDTVESLPEEALPAEAPVPEPLPPTSWSRAFFLAVSLGICFALVGLLVGLRAVAIATLPHILQPGDEINFQEVIDGLPIPRLLDWNESSIEGLVVLKDMSAGVCALAGLFLFGGAWLAAVRALNPTFYLFGVVRDSAGTGSAAGPENAPQAAPAPGPLAATLETRLIG